MKTIKHNGRTSRTRSLIQLGGLLHKAGIDRLFNIQLGDDLQSSPAMLDKAATLLGCLLELYPCIEPKLLKDREEWKKMGIKALKGEPLNF